MSEAFVQRRSIKNCSKKCHKILRETPALEPLFFNVTGPGVFPEDLVATASAMLGIVT